MTPSDVLWLWTVPLVLTAFFVGRIWELRSSQPHQNWLFERARQLGHRAMYEKQMREAAEEHAEQWRRHAKRLESEVRGRAA